MKKSAIRLIGGYILINLLSIGLSFDGTEEEITDEQILKQLDGLKKYSNGYTSIKQLKPVCVNFAYGTIEDNDVICASAIGSLENYGDDTSISVYASYIDELGQIYRIAIKVNFTSDDFEGLHIESATIISYRDSNITQNIETNTTEIGNNVEIDGQLNVNTKPVIAEIDNNAESSTGYVTTLDEALKDDEIVLISYSNGADLDTVSIGVISSDETNIIIKCSPLTVDNSGETNPEIVTIEINKTSGVTNLETFNYTDVSDIQIVEMTITHLM